MHPRFSRIVWPTLLALLLPAGVMALPLGHCAAMVAAIGTPAVKNGTDGDLLCREGYVLSHNGAHLTPDWVVERLVPQRFTGPGDRKKLGDPFDFDPDLPLLGRHSAAPTDYPGFDRGHMAPAASMKFSEQAMRESFYMSNMAPQQGIGLNRHIWADLEGITRDWTCERGELYVITGPIYDSANPARVGAGGVAVPNAFFKAVYDPRPRRFIAFILPNRKIDKHGRKSWEALRDFRVTLTELEDRAGLNLLNGIAPRDKRRLATLRSVMWPNQVRCPAAIAHPQRGTMPGP